MIVQNASLNNQLCTTRQTLINLHFDELSQGLLYYPFLVNRHKCDGSCNTLDDLSSRTCFLNNEMNSRRCKFRCFNMITENNGLKTITKHVLCNFKCSLMVKM